MVVHPQPNIFYQARPATNVIPGRRWNELRRIDGRLQTQQASDGSAYFEMGNTKIICTVNGPQEGRRGAAGREQSQEARIETEISIAGFSGVDRKKRSRNDKRYGDTK